MWSLWCVHKGRTSLICKSRLFYVVCQCLRRNSGLLVPSHRRSGPSDRRSSRGASGVTGAAGVANIAGTLLLLIATQPAPEPKKYQDDKDATTDSAADDRPRRVRVSVCIVRLGRRCVGSRGMG